MNMRLCPKDLVVALATRSSCEYRASALIRDAVGVISVGWNGPGHHGFGEHAEAAAIRRANKRRLRGATLYVATERGTGRNPIFSRPCIVCRKLIKRWGIRNVIWREKKGVWICEDWLAS